MSVRSKAFLLRAALLVVSFSVAAVIAYGVYWQFLKEPVLDTSSPEMFAASTKTMLERLPEEDRPRLQVALKALAYPLAVAQGGMAGAASQPAPEVAHLQGFAGYTFDRLIAEAQVAVDAASNSRLTQLTEERDRIQADLAEYETAKAAIGDTGMVGQPAISGTRDGFFSVLNMAMTIKNGGSQPLKAITAQWRVEDDGYLLAEGTLWVDAPSEPVQPGAEAVFRYRMMGYDANQVYSRATATSKISVRVVAAQWADGSLSDISTGLATLPPNSEERLAALGEKIAHLSTNPERI